VTFSARNRAPNAYGHAPGACACQAEAPSVPWHAPDALVV